jgi:uracil-DNA glycosylase family 4
VEWREQIATTKIRRFQSETYWGKAVPGFGSLEARVLIVGLAPAAHGANRTGRMFTGDRSGDWLYRALHKAGFANQPESFHPNDGLLLLDCRITAAVHCAPPQNKPTPREIQECGDFLRREIDLMPRLRVVVGLGKIAFDRAYRTLMGKYGSVGPRVRFGHGAEAAWEGGLHLLGSFHPSQQNTFTGKLTEPMFDSIFGRVLSLLND